MSAIVPPAGALGELASRLQADDDGSVRRDYCTSFETAIGSARMRLREPLAPEEFEMNAALTEGAELSAEVISAVWHTLHP
jgi:hypothetical protein